MRSFGDSIYTGKINIDEAEMDQSNLLEYMVKSNNRFEPKTKEGRANKKYFQQCNVFKKSSTKKTMSTYVRFVSLGLISRS